MTLYIGNLDKWVKKSLDADVWVSRQDLCDVEYITWEEELLLDNFVHLNNVQGAFYTVLYNRLSRDILYVMYDREPFFKLSYSSWTLGRFVPLNGVWVVECIFDGGTNSLLFFEKDTYNYLGGYCKHPGFMLKKSAAGILLLISDKIEWEII